MITQINFQNFKALKNAEIKLGTFNVIVGPNGSGKSSVLQGLKLLAEPHSTQIELLATVGVQKEIVQVNAIKTHLDRQADKVQFGFVQNRGQATGLLLDNGSIDLSDGTLKRIGYFLSRIKLFSFDASSLAQPVPSQQIMELQSNGRNLAGALTHLHDKDDDAYNQLIAEFSRWIPEYSSIGFDSDLANGYRSLVLKQRATQRRIPASQVSEGTLLSLALLLMIYQSTTPILIGLEEPDRGLHPRLLRELRDSLYRLSFPSDFGIKREPIQVIVTTHSPLFLDLLKDHPEQVIIAEKNGDGTASFKNLSDDPKLRELIGDAPLGEVWYSGILGGVPVPA